MLSVAVLTLQVFDEMPRMDIATSNVVLSRFLLSGHPQDPLSLVQWCIINFMTHETSNLAEYS